MCINVHVCTHFTTFEKGGIELMNTYTYRITKSYYNILSEKRDFKRRLIGRFSKSEVIDFLNKISGFNRPIGDLEIV
jgi:hypothetical protein